MIQKIIWDDIPWEEVVPGQERKVVKDDKYLMLVLYRFTKPGMEWPEEKHLSAQGGYIIEGKVEFFNKTTGESAIVGPGDSYFIDSNYPHNVRILEESLLLDIFAPPRNILMEKGKRFAPEATGR